MPLLHFAYGSLARKGQIDEQVLETCKTILEPRCLKAFSCPEFLPIVNNPGSLWGLPASAQSIGSAGVGISKFVKSPSIGLIPTEVNMICFANFPFKKMAAWQCVEHYGQLAIAFTDQFRNRIGAKCVVYYDLLGLPNDPKVIAYKKSLDAGMPDQMLERELVAYRKPVQLWSEFRVYYPVISVVCDPNGAQVKLLPYDRYAEGYEFWREQEARVVLAEDVEYLGFEPKDVLSIFVPTRQAKQTVENCLTTTWDWQPPVVLFPNKEKI